MELEDMSLEDDTPGVAKGCLMKVRGAHYPLT